MISHKSRESRYGQTNPLYCHAILRWLVPLAPSLVKQAGEDWQFIFFMMLESWRCLVLQLPRVCDAIAMALAEIAARLSAVLGTRSGQPGGRGSALTRSAARDVPRNGAETFMHPRAFGDDGAFPVLEETTRQEGTCGNIVLPFPIFGGSQKPAFVVFLPFIKPVSRFHSAAPARSR